MKLHLVKKATIKWVMGWGVWTLWQNSAAEKRPQSGDNPVWSLLIATVSTFPHIPAPPCPHAFGPWSKVGEVIGAEKLFPTGSDKVMFSYLQSPSLSVTSFSSQSAFSPSSQQNVTKTLREGTRNHAAHFRDEETLVQRCGPKKRSTVINLSKSNECYRVIWS